MLTQFRIIRHGARLPQQDPPIEWYWKQGYRFPKQITEVGKKQAFALGTKLRLLDSEYLFSNTTIFASKKQRTTESARNFMAAYFQEEPQKIPTLSKKIFHNQKKKLMRDIKMRIEPEHRLEISLMWKRLQTIGIRPILEKHFPMKLKLVVEPNDILGQLKFMKNLYTNYYCGLTDGHSVEEFTPEIIHMIRRAQSLFYFYYWGNEFKVLLGVSPFLKLMGKQIQVYLSKNMPELSPAYMKQVRRYHKQIKLGRNVLLFGHDRNLLTLGYFFGGRTEMNDRGLDMYDYVSRLSFSLEVIDEEFFLHRIKK